MPARTLAPKGVDCEIQHQLGRRTKHSSRKGVETFPYHTHFKNLEGKPERECLKRTIFANGGFGPLQYMTCFK